MVRAELFVSNHGVDAHQAYRRLFGPKICGRRRFNSARGEGNASRHTGGRTVRSVNTPDGAGLAILGSMPGSDRKTRIPHMMLGVRSWESAERAAGGADDITWALPTVPDAITKHATRARLVMLASGAIIRRDRTCINGV